MWVVQSLAAVVLHCWVQGCLLLLVVVVVVAAVLWAMGNHQAHNSAEQGVALSPATWPLVLT
jgi:hypothetical protein